MQQAEVISNTACGTVPTATEIFECQCGSRICKKNKANHMRTKKHMEFEESQRAANLSVVASDETFIEDDEENPSFNVKKIMYNIVQRSIEDMVHIVLTEFFANLSQN